MKDGPLRRRRGPKAEPKSQPEPPLPVCPCGSREKVWVHSHYQCAKCGRVLSSCCEGEPW